MLIVCDRPVDGRKLARLANLLAVTRMRTPHDENWRVQWIFRYAHNLAYRALREGYEADAICAAYAAGVARSHEDSLDADRPVVTGLWRREPLRVPSAAVAYAWRELLRDGRDREERWEAIFARGPRPGPAVPTADVAEFTRRRNEAREKSSSGGSAAPPPQIPTTPPGPEPRRATVRKSLEELRGILAAAEKPGERLLDPLPITDGELAAFLRETKKMTLAQFCALGWGWKKAVWREAIAWKASKI